MNRVSAPPRLGRFVSFVPSVFVVSQKLIFLRDPRGSSLVIFVA
jgi:hypothetical protein